MFNFFQTIINYIETIWGFVVNFISSLFTLIQTLLTVTKLPPLLIGYVPSFIAASVMVITSLAVLKVVLGR